MLSAYTTETGLAEHFLGLEKFLLCTAEESGVLFKTERPDFTTLAQAEALTQTGGPDASAPIEADQAGE